MKKIHLLAASVLVSGALAMTGCSSGARDAEDGVQAMENVGPDVQTNGQSETNPDLLPTSYKNLGGAKDWNVDGTRSMEENDTPSTAYAVPGPTDINPTQPPTMEPEATDSNDAPSVDPNKVTGFDGAASADAPTDKALELQAMKPFVIKASGFKPDTLVYAYIYFKDAEGNGDTLTNSISDSSGNVSVYGYVPQGFKSDANYTIRVAGIDGDSQGVYSSVPLRIVK